MSFLQPHRSGPVQVLWVIKGLGRGGAEQLLVNLARNFDEREVRLSVAYTLPHKDALAEDLANLGVRVYDIGADGHWAWSLRRLLRTTPFDLVHSHSPLPGTVARVFAPREMVLTHTEHNVWGRYRLPTRLLNAATLGRNSAVWAVSDGVAESMRPYPHAGRPDVRVLLHGLADTAPVTGDSARAQARDRLGLPADAFVIGTVGNLTAKKDHDTLIASFTTLRERVPGARLVIVGGGPRHDHLSDRVQRLGLGSAVVLAGVRADVPDLLPGFDVFAMSSLYEGLSIALLEAMAAGVAPVVTAVGGLPEVVTDQVDGLLVPPSSPDALSCALEVLARDPELRAKLGRAAHGRAQAFGIRPAAATLTREYQRLARRPRSVTAP